MRRFFIGSAIVEQADSDLSSLAEDSFITLPQEIYHHWCRVLRAKVGDQSMLFDGLGGEHLVELHAIDKKSATVRIISHNDVDRLPQHYTTVAIVMSRGDRMDYAIQKSTELGATVIQLLTSQHGEVRLKPQQVDKKLAHWQQVALSACEQCGLNRPPLVLSPLSIEDWLQGKQGNPIPSINYLSQDKYYKTYTAISPLKLVLAVPHQNEQDSIDIHQSIIDYLQQSAGNVTTDCYDKNTTSGVDISTRFDILIGAEGGLSLNEYALSRKQDFLPWQIGQRILRTETAPVVALSLLNFCI